MHIKICGITRVEDATRAMNLGAHALGFVFWPRSPRAVSVARARRITDVMPALVARVGVFVNQPPTEVARTVRDVRLTAIQLHGDEDASAYAEIGVPVIKALPVTKDFTLSAVQGVPAGMTVLLDAHDPVRRGGTGRPVEWTVAAAAARVRPVILSGGLRPENVRQAIEAVRPCAVDVSSGVESAPGKKDESKLRAFFAALRSQPVHT